MRPGQMANRVVGVFRKLLIQAVAGDELPGGYYRGVEHQPRAEDPYRMYVNVSHRVFVNPQSIHTEAAAAGAAAGPFFRTPIIEYRLYNTVIAKAYLEYTGWKIDFNMGNYGHSRYTKDVMNLLFDYLASSGYKVKLRLGVLYLETPMGDIAWEENTIFTFNWDEKEDFAFLY